MLFAYATSVNFAFNSLKYVCIR